jgi:predicted Zn-dependent protease
MGESKIIRPIILLLLLVVTIGCDKSPTGRRQLLLIPSSQLIKMGFQAFEHYKQTMLIENDPHINNYVSCVTQALIESTPGLREQRWEVAVFRNPVPNAFALPGGKIGINTGMLNMASKPGQLAAVIGHEIGHVMAQHSNERLTQQLGIKAVLFLVNLFSDEPGSWKHELLMKSMGLGAKVGVILPFSRTHEREADLIGLDLMARAGFDPRQSIRLWENMSQVNRKQPLEFLSTHPSHESRIEELSKKLQSPLALYKQALANGRNPGCM